MILKFHKNKSNQQAFTLIEILIVISVISVMLSVLVPCLAKARQQSQTVVCKSNIRQLSLANTAYAMENDSEYVLAAPDIFTGNNLKRWHGIRDNLNSFFEAERSSLYPYLSDKRSKECPVKVNFRIGDPWDWDFEQGCGGYGYNMTYIGSRIWENYTAENCGRPTRETEVKSPSSTLMFADTAMVKLDYGKPYYLEYSFAEPCYFVVNGKPDSSWGQPSPSIHFRHNQRANVAWCDGHVTSEMIVPSTNVNVYGASPYDNMIGWFAPLNNSCFDLK